MVPSRQVGTGRLLGGVWPDYTILDSTTNKVKPLYSVPVDDVILREEVRLGLLGPRGGLCATGGIIRELTLVLRDI